MAKPLTKDTMQVGMRVRCIWFGIYLGLTGTVESFNPLGHNDFEVIIVWDDGHHDNNGWAYPSSFEAVDPNECMNDCCKLK